MKASEFVNEGIGDWFDKTSRASIAKRHSKAQKANVPKIAKAIHQLLANKVNNALGRADASETEMTQNDLARLVINVLKKTLKVDPYKGDLKGPAREIIDSVMANPGNIKKDVSIAHNIEAMTLWSMGYSRYDESEDA